MPLIWLDHASDTTPCYCYTMQPTSRARYLAGPGAY